MREALVDAAGVQDLTISQVTEAQGVRVRFVVTNGAVEEGEDVAPTLEDAYVNLLRGQRELI